jgi:hypothetical protein
MRYQRDRVPGDSVILITDVDYYLDMPGLMGLGKPIIIYTFSPEEVAGSTDDGVYCTNLDDTVTVTINGGAQYRHGLWNYDTDHIMVHHRWWSYVYLVEQIRVSNTRRIVFLNPVKRLPRLLAEILPGRGLGRKRFNTSGVVQNRFVKGRDTGSEVWYSLAFPGQHEACNVSSSAYHATRIRLMENKDPHLSDVERYFNTYKVDNPLFSASLFYHIYKRYPNALDVSLDLGITPIVVDRHTYQPTEGLASEDGRPTMRAIWPGYGTAFSPAKSNNSDKACLQGRVEEPRNKRRQIPDFYNAYIREFVEMLVPDGTKCAPWSFEQIWDHLKRPTQRHQLTTADYNSDAKVTVKSFQKREAYPKATHPRNISTLPMAHNFTLGQFTIPFKDIVLKNVHWYAFGKHPKKFSDILHSKAVVADNAVTTDFDKLDGSIHPVFRDIFVAAMLRAFPAQYHDEIRKREKAERSAKGYTAFGIQYDVMDSVTSGSSDTSILGTLTNVFIMYTTYRQTWGPADSWANLGLYGGDDGVSFDVSIEHVMRVSANFGMSCRADTVLRGHPITFLGRVFTDLWTSPGSMADVQRQMRKIHLTATPTTVPDWLVLYRKAIGYLVTDPNTPLLAEWCQAVVRIVQPMNPEGHKMYKLTEGDQPYWSTFESPYYEVDDLEYCAGYIANSLGLTTDELQRYRDGFITATSIEDLYKVDIFRYDSKFNISVCHRGEVIAAQPRTTIPENVENNLQYTLAVCRFARRNAKCPYEKCKFSHFVPKNSKRSPAAEGVHKKQVRTAIRAAVKTKM